MPAIIIKTHKENPLVRFVWKEVQSDQERQAPQILRHCHQRPFINGLGDESNPKHRDHPDNRTWDRQQVRIEG